MNIYTAHFEDYANLRAENARLQERVKEAERHDCGYALQRTLEIAERQMALAKVRGEALEEMVNCHAGYEQGCGPCICEGHELACAAIAMTPEEAKEKEG